VSKLAALELPENQWPECIPALKTNASQVADANARHGALVTLGFVCQDISEIGSECLEAQANDVLTAVIHGLRKEEPSMDIKFVAAQALNNALEFAHDIFQRAEERNYIMTQVCEATQAADQRVRKESMECLCTIAYHYYGHMMAYMQAISQLTLKAIKEDEQEVGTTALEFWSTIVEEELGIQDELEESGTSEQELLNITVQAVPHFVPVLLECLTKQTGDEDDDEWTVYKAAGVCLELVSQCAKDSVVEIVMTFVNANVTNANWIFQDAATLAFGALLDGPSEEKLRPWVDQATRVFLATLINEQARVEVRDTTAWAIAKILENHPGLVAQDVFPQLLEALIKCLKCEPRVAVHVCFALEKLAKHIEELSADEASNSNQLSGVMAPLMQALVVAADRPDASETTGSGHDLMTCAYDALDVLVQGSAADCAPLMVQLCPVIVKKLQSTFSHDQTNLGATEKSQLANMQGHCCGVLMGLVTKIDKASLEQQAGAMMQCFLHLFATRAATVYEEAYMAIGTLACHLGASFQQYMGPFAEILGAGLANAEEHSICLAAVGVIGDVCRALERNVLPYCDAIMLQLMKNLIDQNLHRSVKPPILSAFGDIALAIGSDFERFLDHSMTMLHNAGSIEMEINDPDDEDYRNQLHENIIEGYSGVIQALHHCQRAQLLEKFLPNICAFIETKIVNCQDRDPQITKCSINLVGDLAQAMKQAVKAYFQNPWVLALMNSAADADCLADAQWAHGQITQWSS
jgi:importin subunit beta-1